MTDLKQIILLGFKYSRDKFVLFLIVFASTFLLMEYLKLILTQDQVVTQIYWLIGLFAIENFFTCGVYGSLKRILSGEKLTSEMFLKNCIQFFARFLGIKILFVVFLGFISGIILILAETAGKISSFPATASIVFLWLVWLSLPVYYFVLALFAPIVLFSENSTVWQSVKISIGFSRIFLDRIIVIAFLYFISVVVFVYFPEKSYNLSSQFWFFLKGIIVSILEIGFISSFLLMFQKEWHDERNI